MFKRSNIISIDSNQGSHESLKAFMDAAADAMIISDRNGLILRTNAAAQAYFGYTDEELIGQNVHCLMPEPDHGRHDSYLKNYLDSGDAKIIGIGREVIALHADGNTFPIHLSVGEIKGDSEAKFVAIIRDLSAEKATQDVVKELETHLAHADRLVMLGELTAGIAHEINQPLTAIAAFADAGASLLESNTPESLAELENVCLRVSEQARRAGDVVNRLRSLSRKGELTRSTHNIQNLVKTILLLFNHELKQSNISLTTHFDQDLPEMVVDEIQVQQVLVNLVKNAFDVLNESEVENPCIEINVLKTDKSIDINVVDNGPGVPTEFKRKLFEPFFTTKKHGVGLGLSICKNIALMHGGSLSQENLEEGGARFTLSLPLSFIG
jgi:two-component system sensor kinase FixL